MGTTQHTPRATTHPGAGYSPFSTAARPSLCLKGVCSLATHVASLARLDQGRITGSDLNLQAHDVVVVVTVIELEYGLTARKMVTRHECRLLKLREHAIDGCEPDIVVVSQQFLVDVLSTQMVRIGRLEDLEDAQAGQRDFQPRFAQVMSALLRLPFLRSR